MDQEFTHAILLNHALKLLNNQNAFSIMTGSQMRIYLTKQVINAMTAGCLTIAFIQKNGHMDAKSSD